MPMGRWLRLGSVGRWSWLGVLGRVPSGADRALDEAQARGFRFLWAVLPEPEIARDLRFQHLLFSRFSFDAPWPTWEIHPHGDEFVYLLSGDTDFVLHTDTGEEVVRINEPGSYVMVPKNTWHTARPHAPTTMLFVTPGEGTLNSETPG